jgi:hypothetical protein
MILAGTTRQARCRRLIGVLLVGFLLCPSVIYLCRLYSFSVPGTVPLNLDDRFGHRPPPDLFNLLDLREGQCEATFPGLTRDIREHVDLGPFELMPSGDNGPLQVQIKDQKASCFLGVDGSPCFVQIIDRFTAFHPY